MTDKISLAGDLGSGKSTVAKILIDRLGAEYYSTGAIVRSIAEQRGMTVAELNTYMETHPEIDHEIDAGIAALSELDKALIIDSRMAWHFTKGTFKVYLSCDIETSSLRIMNANREGEHSATLEETVKATKARRDSERKRYSEQYGVDIKDLTNYDLIVDTTYATPEQIADRIIASAADFKAGTLKPTEAYLAPERINYPDTEANQAEVDRLYNALSFGEAPLPSEVTEHEGEFYLIRGLEAAMAHSLNFSVFVPARLVKAPVPGGDFVKMKDSL